MPAQYENSCQGHRLRHLSQRWKMKQFLVDKYRASTFNTCQHQPLPMMQGPKMELFVQKDARPHAEYQPAVVPVH